MGDPALDALAGVGLPQLGRLGALLRGQHGLDALPNGGARSLFAPVGPGFAHDAADLGALFVAQIKVAHHVAHVTALAVVTASTLVGA